MPAFKRLAIAHLLALVLGIASAVLPTQAADNPKRGGEVYSVCSACHSLQPGIHLSGPSLADMWGKKAASAEGFVRYSKVFKSEDFAWDENTLNAWLADPKAMVPGNYMTFRGIRNDRDRGDLIAFLKLAMAPGGAKAVIDKGLITADGAEGQTPEDLSSVGPKQQVTGLRHCRDTYVVTTADGTETPYWEMNVRLKTDTSRFGPPSGKPAITRSGMMGDRVSIVFYSAAEIAATVKTKC
jgi:cytochrome c